MKRIFIRINGFVKGLVLIIRPHLFLGWMKPFLLFTFNTLALTKWIARQDQKNMLNDFYSFKRDYSKRYQLYEYVVNHLHLKDEVIDYLEFGVSRGQSFKWWLEHSVNPQSRFYGFDTFEGLPEDWGTYNKGDMAAAIPVVNDARAEFIKGLFQDSVPGFLSSHHLQNQKRKIIHLDADLFSSTLYALTSLAPYLKRGDVLLFDEFNVPNHEFYAFRLFSDAFYIKTKLCGAVNNYLQVAFTIE
jgi:O-methyltransferase